MCRASIDGSSYNRRSAATIRLAANLSEGERQMYPEIMVIPMREELARAGVKEARTAADVDTAIAQPGTTMLVVNSICRLRSGQDAAGCSSGNAAYNEAGSCGDGVRWAGSGCNREGTKLLWRASTDQSGDCDSSRWGSWCT